MTNALALVRLLPWLFLGRLAAAFVEISAAVVILCGSVVVGHFLGEWRAWYSDPATGHPWSPSAKPSATVAALAMPAVAIPVGITQRSFLCRTSTGERLVLEHPAEHGPGDAPLRAVRVVEPGARHDRCADRERRNGHRPQLARPRADRALPRRRAERRCGHGRVRLAAHHAALNGRARPLEHLYLHVERGRVRRTVAV